MKFVELLFGLFIILMTIAAFVWLALIAERIIS